MRLLLQIPKVSTGAHKAELAGVLPGGDVPLALDYATWVENTWPSDVLELMGGRSYDGASAHALTLYRVMIARRAYEIRVKGLPVEQVAYDPGTFADVDPNLQTPSLVAGKDAAGNPLKVLTPSEAPSFISVLANQDNAGILKETYGVDSVLGIPAAIIAKFLQPLVWTAVVIGLIVLAFKLPDFSGVKVKANIGGTTRKKGKAA